MDNVCLYAFLWLLIHNCAILWLLIWTQIPRVQAQWLEQLSADQQVPGSIPGGGMVYFRDRIRQSDESNESDDQQHEPDYKKVS